MGIADLSSVFLMSFGGGNFFFFTETNTTQQWKLTKGCVGRFIFFFGRSRGEIIDFVLSKNNGGRVGSSLEVGKLRP